MTHLRAPSALRRKVRPFHLRFELLENRRQLSASQLPVDDTEQEPVALTTPEEDAAADDAAATETSVDSIYETFHVTVDDRVAPMVECPGLEDRFCVPTGVEPETVQSPQHHVFGGFDLWRLWDNRGAESNDPPEETKPLQLMQPSRSAFIP